MLSDQLNKIATNQYHQSELEQVFDQVATNLLRNTKLVAGKEQYIIKEIQFYFVSDHYGHQDPFTHKHKRQLLFAQWYFHRYKSFDTYTKQKFKGLDITFGDKQQNNFGGILIRKIQNIQTNAMIDGIGKIVSAIINDIGQTEFELSATNELPKVIFDGTNLLHLEDFENSIDNPIYKTSRKNLGTATLDELKFRGKKYNYFNDVDFKLVAK